MRAASRILIYPPLAFGQAVTCKRRSLRKHVLVIHVGHAVTHNQIKMEKFLQIVRTALLISV